MTVKQFFKSTSFKCIISLLCILLVCGIFLTVAYGFLEVTDEERLQRAISQIYGQSVTATEQDISDKNTNLDYSIINNIYYIEDDGNYLVNVSGKNGHGGNVTCWVVIYTSDDGNGVKGVGQVVISSAPGESYLSYIKDSHLALFSNEEYYDGIVYEYGFNNSGDVPGDMYVKTNASRTMRAICNAVNGAIDFIKAYLSGVDIVNPWADFQYYEKINMEETIWTVEDGVVTYEIVTQSNAPAGAFKMTVSVGSDKTISSYEITTYGSVDNDYGNVKADYYNDKINVSLFTGKDLAYFESIIENGDTNEKYEANGLSTGATRSNYLCLYAGAFATSNYDYCLENPSEVTNNE